MKCLELSPQNFQFCVSLEIDKLTDANQALVGIIIYGENKKVNKALNGLKFHG